MAKLILDMERDPMPRKKVINGIHFTVATPPHLLPDAMEPELNESGRSMIIYFRYQGDEEEMEELYTEGPVKVLVGINTRKILAVEIMVADYKLDRVQLLITDSADKLMHAPQSDEFVAANYERASKALSSRADDIAQFAMQ